MIILIGMLVLTTLVWHFHETKSCGMLPYLPGTLLRLTLSATPKNGEYVQIQH